MLSVALIPRKCVFQYRSFVSTSRRLQYLYQKWMLQEKNKTAANSYDQMSINRILGYCLKYETEVYKSGILRFQSSEIVFKLFIYQLKKKSKAIQVGFESASFCNAYVTGGVRMYVTE